MFQSRRFDGTGGSSDKVSRRRSGSGKNGFSGTLADLAHEDKPLRRIKKFNAEKNLDTVYTALLGFVFHRTTHTLELDLHTLRYALGMNGENPVIIFSKLVHDILEFEHDRKQDYEIRMGRNISKAELPQKSDREVTEIAFRYAIRRGSKIELTRIGAMQLISFIDEVASENGYRWVKGAFRKYSKDIRFAAQVSEIGILDDAEN